MAPTLQDTTTLCAGDNSTNGTSSRVTTNSTFTSKKSNESASSSTSNSSSNSYNSSNSNSFNNNNSNNIANIMSITDLDNLLPVNKRGLFYQDSFFKEARQHYDTAMREVLDNWGQRSALEDDLTTYRKLRESHLTEDSRAATVTEHDTHHQVVLDVKDFEKGEVKVKVVDENEVVVEGSVEQVEGSSTSTKRFRRSFTFPGKVRSEVITATTSSDGVLTVTVPKKDSPNKLEGVNGHCTVKNMTNLDTSSKESPSVKKKSTNTTQCSSTTSGDSIKLTDTQDSRCQSSSRSSVFSDHLFQARALEDDLLSSTATVGSEPSWTLDSLLPVDHRGLFFHDSFFQDAHQHFESAVNEVLTKFGRSESSDDDLSVYRSLRQRDLRDENQAVKVTENHHSHQVVMDVRDFMKGDVKVKMVGEKEVEVEGVVEECEGDSKSCRSFRRRFHLPGLVEVDAVTSALSSDGVLTITAPKVTRT